MKKLFSVFLAIAMIAISFTASLAVYAAPTSAEIQGAEERGDVSALEALVSQQETEGTRASAKVTIDDTVSKTFNRDLLGVQWEVTSRGYKFLADGTEDLTPLYRDMANRLFDSNVARWGGSSTNDINLIQSIKPMDERGDVYHVDKPSELLSYASNFGIVEFIKANLAINPDMKFIFVVGPWANTPADVNNFTHFLLDTTGEWAEMRRSYGLLEPINLMAYEMGNENYFIADPDRDIYSPTATRDYADKAIAIIESVRADFPGVVFTANVRGRSAVSSNGVPWDDNWIVDIGRFLHKYIDGNISYHSYYELAATNANMDHIIAKYKEGAGSSANVKFWITENAMFGASNQALERHNLNCALFNAIFLNEIAERGDVVCANYHNVAAENWTLFSLLDGKLFSQPTNDVYRLYETKMGNTYYPTSETTSASGRFSALATVRDDGRMVICMVNMDESTPLHVTFNYKSKTQYTLLHKTTYTGPNIMSAVVSENTKDLFTTTEASPSQDPFTAITVPSKSIVFAVAQKKDVTYGKYVEPYVEDPYIGSVEKSYYDVRMGDEFVTRGTEPENVIYVQKTANADAQIGVASNVLENSFPYSIDIASLVGDGVTYSLAPSVAGNEINLCGTEFSITPPYKQSTLKGVTSARMGQYGGLTFDGGPAISATEYIYRRDMLTWSPAIMKELGNAYTLSVSGNKNKYPSFGVRFHINREFNSYYLLNVNGSKNDASSPAWTLYKVTDGTNPVELTKSEKSARVVGDFELEMQVNGGNVTVSVTHSGSTETKTFSDSAPFAHTAGDAGTVAFVKSDGGEVKIKAVSVDAENAEDVRVITAVDDNGKALGTAKVTTASFSGGDGITYTGSSSEQKIGTSDFLMMGPATGYSPLNSPIQAVMQKGGPLVISAGANQAALNYNDRKCMVVWKPDGMMAAIKNYRITADAYVENSHPGLGMRFHINSDRSSYYMLNIHSPQRDPGKPLWVLYKTVGGKTFPVMTSDAVTSVDTSNYMRYDYKLDVTVVDNYVTVAVTWDGGKKSEYKTFCDQEPFSYGANSSAFIGFTKNGSGEVKINALKLETYSQSERVQNHRFGDGIIIRKIENPGNTPAKVFVSNDTNGIYELLGVVPAKGKFVNCLTAKKMTNVRVEGGSDLRFYSDIKDIPAYAVAGELLPLSARIGGKDAPYATFESSRKNIIEISDGKLIPLQTGKTDITAADSGASYTENDVESRFFGKWEESFDSYGNTSVKESSRKTSARDVTVSGDWILRQNIGGPINANPKAMVSDGAMLLSGPSLVPTDKRIAYLIYDKELAGLGGRYEINAELNKYNAASGIGMKFHIHDNYDQSYYMLMLNGTNADMNTWTFYKVVRGKVVDSVKGPSFGSPAESGNGAYSGGDISVKIKVDGNRINWSVYGARVGESATLSAGAYTDDGFTPISGSYGRIAFVASNAANISTDGYHKIYSVSVTENVTKFFRPTVKEYDEGNIVFLPAYNYGNSARFIIAASNGGSMHDFDIFSNADFSDLSAKAFYIPKDMFGKTKIFVWDMTKLRPFGKFITELG